MKRTLRDQYAQKSANTMANVKPYKTSSGYGWRFACPQCGLTENGFKKQSTHRAMDDIQDSIEELRYYRRSFFSI